MHETSEQKERAIAVGAGFKGSDRELAMEHLNELEDLAETAGAEVIEKVYQEFEKPNPKTYIGKGKVEEVKLAILDDNINIVIFDDDLSPLQLRNLENMLGVKVVDRSGLILDIFAKHARTLEAKTQVELAQLQYMLPRLTKMWTHLSKQYGGIGTKGPGETQIETDRRIIRERIQRLKDKLKEIAVQKEQQRKGREVYPRFALVGYTNAGKSTIMNAITSTGVFVEDMLFATLDTTVRAFEMANGFKALLSDTVGFIRKLPAHLVASFRSTLAEAAEADVIVHVVDITHKYFHEHIKVVEDTLNSLKITNKPVIMVFNKIDLLPDREGMRLISEHYPDSIFISAKRNININGLLDLFRKKYDENSNRFDFILPWSEMNKISALYSISEILKREDKEEGIELEVSVHPDNIDLFRYNFSKFLI